MYDVNRDFSEGAIFIATSLTGSSAAEKLNNTDSDVIILAQSGNDTITNTVANVTIYGGYGADTIINSGTNSTVNAGKGADTITNSGANTTVTGGYGNDSVLNSGSKVSINAYSGDDSIRNGANFVTINAGEGNDTIKVGNTSVTSFSVENIGAGDVIELYRAVNSIEIKNGALVAGSVTISGVSSMAGENDVWAVDGNSATLTRTNTGGTKLGSDGKTITFEADTDEAEELFVISGLKDSVTSADLKANVTVSGTQVTVNENILGDDEVNVSEGFTLVLADTVPKSEEVPAAWQVNGSTVTYTGEHFTEGYALVEGTIVHRDTTDGDTFTLTGVKKNLTKSVLNANVTIDGNKVILSADALGKSNVTLTTEDDFTLALGDDCPTVGAVDKVRSLSGTTATYHDAGKSDGYKLTNSKTVTYTAPTGGKALLTLKGLAEGFSIVDGAIDGLTLEDKTLTVTPDIVGDNDAQKFCNGHASQHRRRGRRHLD